PADQVEYRITSTGTVLDATGITLHASVTIEGNRQAASDGQVLATHWHDNLGNVLVSRVAPNGTVLDPAGIRVGSGFYAGMAASGYPEPAITASGPGTFWITWTTTSGRVAARLHTDGGLPDPPAGILVSPTIDFGDIACGSSGTCLTVWEDNTLYGSAETLVARRLDPGGMVLDDASQPLLAEVQGVPQELLPAVACNSATCFAAWSEWSNPNDRANLNGLRLAPGGAAIGATARMSCNKCDWPARTAAAASPTQFLAVWTASSNHVVTAARMRSSDGTVLDVPELQLDPGEINDGETVAAVFDGTQFVAA